MYIVERTGSGELSTVTGGLELEENDVFTYRKLEHCLIGWLSLKYNFTNDL